MTNRHLYPNDWEVLRAQCLARAGNHCEHCGVENETVAKSDRTGKRYFIYLHAAHVHHDISNPNPELIALCPTCHGRYDYAHKERQRQLDHERFMHRILLAKPLIERWWKRA